MRQQLDYRYYHGLAISLVVVGKKRPNHRKFVTMTEVPKPFRYGHLVRLRGFNHEALDGKLARVDSHHKSETGKNLVEFLSDAVHPPVPLNPRHASGAAAANAARVRVLPSGVSEAHDVWQVQDGF